MRAILFGIPLAVMFGIGMATGGAVEAGAPAWAGFAGAEAAFLLAGMAWLGARLTE